MKAEKRRSSQFTVFTFRLIMPRSFTAGVFILRCTLTRNLPLSRLTKLTAAEHGVNEADYLQNLHLTHLEQARKSFLLMQKQGKSYLKEMIMNLFYFVIC
jgi:hypothetical protein